MVNGAFFSRSGPGDLRLEQLDAFLQFLDRERIEILLAQLLGEIVLATRKVFVGFHRATNVDRWQRDVNKTPGSYGARNYA